MGIFCSEEEAALSGCALCPRGCGVNRLRGERGFCGAGSAVRAARAAPHFWEEPCISGERGSGTVFFSHCVLGCRYCQNAGISRGGGGFEVGEDELAGIFLSLEAKGAHNINLVTPTHYAPQIAAAIRRARGRGLLVPVVYNCGGYESVEGLRLLEGLVDVYLPDFKYWEDRYAVRYSRAPRYREAAAAAVEEMFRQVGEPVFGEDGMMKKGVIVRHLMLPGALYDSKRILDFLWKAYGNRIYISLMNQYTPMPGAQEFPELQNPLEQRQYEAMVAYLQSLGMENVFIQEGGTVGESFIPSFDGEGIIR